MLNVYILENLSKQNNRKLLNSLPSFLQEEINKYTNNEVINIKVSAYYLLFKKLNELFQIKEDQFIYSKYGKPYLKHNSNVYFNISHTKNMAVVAVSTSEVGIDVMEYIDCIDEVVNYSFNENEKLLLNNAQDKNKEFVKIWANKEAYLKYKALGINSKMNQIDTTKLSIPTKYFDNYLISYCSNEKEINFIKINNLD